MKKQDAPLEIISPYCVNVVISRILFPKCREEFFDWKLNLNLYPQWDEKKFQETFLFLQFTRKQLFSNFSCMFSNPNNFFLI